MGGKIEPGEQGCGIVQQDQCDDGLVAPTEDTDRAWKMRKGHQLQRDDVQPHLVERCAKTCWKKPEEHTNRDNVNHSTVTDFARFRG